MTEVQKSCQGWGHAKRSLALGHDEKVVDVDVQPGSLVSQGVQGADRVHEVIIDHL